MPSSRISFSVGSGVILGVSHAFRGVYGTNGEFPWDFRSSEVVLASSAWIVTLCAVYGTSGGLYQSSRWDGGVGQSWWARETWWVSHHEVSGQFMVSCSSPQQQRWGLSCPSWRAHRWLVFHQYQQIM